MSDESAAHELKNMIVEKTGVIVESSTPLFLKSRLHSLLHYRKFEGLDQLVQKIKSDSELFDEVIDVVTTHESLFFRDDLFFEVLRKKIIPFFHESRRHLRKLRVWSAACALGQEPYSIAMELLNHELDFSSWDIQIYATDISKMSVKKASEGIFSHFDVQRGLNINLLAKYFEKHPQGWKIQDRVKKMVVFDNLNLVDINKPLSNFDIVLLRNVLIYFSVENKRKVLTSVLNSMSRDGCLGLGGPETLLGLNVNFSSWDNTVSGAPVYRPNLS